MYLIPPPSLIGPRPVFTAVQGKQTNAAPTGSGKIQTLTMAAQVGLNNFLCVGVLFSLNSGTLNTGPLLTLTDDKGNTYQQISCNISPGATNPIGYSTFVSTGPALNHPQTLTLTSDMAWDNIWMLADEFSASYNYTTISVDGCQNFYGFVGQGSTPQLNTTRGYGLIWSVTFATGTGQAYASLTAAQGSGTEIQSAYHTNNELPGLYPVTFSPVTTGVTYTTTTNISCVGPTTWRWRQSQVQKFQSGTSGTVSFKQPALPGSLIVGSIAGDPSQSISTLTSIRDDTGNSYSLVAPTTAKNTSLFWSGGYLANGPQTITASYSTSQSQAYFLLNEFLPPPGAITASITDSSNVYAYTSGTPPITLGPLTNVQGGQELIYAYCAQLGAGQAQYPIQSLSGSSGTWGDGWFVNNTAGTLPTITWDTLNNGAQGASSTGIMSIRAFF